MRQLLLLALLMGLGACASSSSDTAPAAPVAAEGASAWHTLADMQGAEHDLAGSLAEGREVALVFWQTWCASCIAEAPHVVAAAAERAGTTEFYGVVSGPDDVVDDDKVREMTEQLGLTYPQVRDRSADLARHFDVEGTPTIIVIAPGGEISYRGHRLPETWTTP